MRSLSTLPPLIQPGLLPTQTHGTNLLTSELDEVEIIQIVNVPWCHNYTDFLLQHDLYSLLSYKKFGAVFPFKQMKLWEYSEIIWKCKSDLNAFF